MPSARQGCRSIGTDAVSVVDAWSFSPANMRGFELTAIAPHRRLIGRGLFALLAMSMLATGPLAQTPPPMPPGPPPNPARPPLAPVDQADADYRFLADPANRADFWDVVKYVPLDRTGDSYLTFGFEARAEYEYFHNQMWGGGPQDTDGYFLGRLIPAVGLTLQPHVRLFAAFQYEKESGNPAGPRPHIDEDQRDFHEAFVDLSTGLDEPRSVTARLGQQELVYGNGKLIDNNEGVNVKSSFYGGRLILRRDDLRLDVFGTLPTELNTGTFDDRPNPQQTFWGAYGTGPLRLIDPDGQVDLYYLGIDTLRATYQQGSGREVRHTIGTRLFDRPPGGPLSPGFDYDVEVMYQFGTFGQNGISAWGATTDTGFTFSLPWAPRIALRAAVASGGRRPNGGDLNTFNPLFPRGAYFGPKMNLLGPYNVFTVHPLLMFSPLSNVSCDLDAVWFWRESLEDGLYQIGGALLRRGTRFDARYIGNQINFELRWALDLHTTIAINLAGFITGDFLKDTGPSDNVAFSNVGITYRF